MLFFFFFFFFSINFIISLDEIWYTAMTCWSVQAGTNFFGREGGGGEMGGHDYYSRVNSA